MKHLRAYTKEGYTFGMDVDGRQAARVLKKEIRIENPRIVSGVTYMNYRWGLPALLIASLMGEASWLVTECRDFTKVQIGDSMWYEVIYDEEKEEKR